jgi:hypothetical protein
MMVSAKGGGTVAVSDGTSVSVPPGSLGQDTPITVAPEPDMVTVSGATPVGMVYRFGPEGTQFATPATVTLTFDPSLLPAGLSPADIVVMTAPVGSSHFEALTTTVVDATHVSATTSHFSDFVATAKDEGKDKPDLSVDNAADLGAPQPDLAKAQPAADLSQAAADLSSPPDLTARPDLTSACPHTYNVNCTMSTGTGSACGITGYSLDCRQTSCWCSGGNLGKACPKAAPDTGTLNCPGQANMETMWTSCCGFP